MEKASRPQLRRLFYLDRQIREGKYPNATTLALELEVHARTIARDLAFLRDSWKAPLAFCPKRNGYFYAENDFALPALRMAEGEVIAVFLGERLLQEYAGSPFAGALASIFQKIMLSMPEHVTVDLNHLETSYSIRHQKATVQDAKTFSNLAKAIRENRQLHLQYYSASRDETTKRIVDPYHLVSVQGDWYLVAYCHLREEIRMFVPGRIRTLQETGHSFERQADFQIRDYLDHSFRTYRGDGKPIKVSLRFSPEMSRYIPEKQWHPSQKLSMGKDGRLTVTFQISHLLEVRRWAMSYGSDCEVLEPEELRAEVLAEVKKMQAFYQK
ncbi:MAG: helix-turn-helix transcriptional regulator [Bdellovibrionales bacterium]